jgi:hypothetical protein
VPVTTNHNVVVTNENFRYDKEEQNEIDKNNI